MEREQKIWGERWLIRVDSTHAVSYLRVNKGMRCSWHKHQTKWNLFVVLSGQIGIKTEEGTMVLGPGETAQIRPGVAHEFYADTDSEIIEEMFVTYDDEDIERFKPGGRIVKGKRRRRK